MNDSLNTLNTTLKKVAESGTKINGASNQVSSASQMLSEGATEQAASLEQITASLTEMSSQTKQNADYAVQATGLTKDVKKAASSGTELMGSLSDAMKKIEGASDDISKIIKVIDEIAFQTNLLALNAAVEAARAGSHGKGFAVVAEEVRNLAARSSKAAKETADLIENAVNSVKDGTHLTQETSSSLEEIAEGIIKTAELVDEISQASHEQALGISQINEGLMQLDGVTQQNTAQSEEAAAVAHDLAEQSDSLNQVLKQFVLSQGSELSLTSKDAGEIDMELVKRLAVMLDGKI